MRLRRALARISKDLGTSVAIFDVLPAGVRCRLRHLRPDGVGFIAEHSLRENLHGHGVAVLAAAYDSQVRRWHAATLRQFLRLTGPEWRQLLATITRQGWYAGHALEGGVASPEIDPTLVRLSIPIRNQQHLLGVFCASGHGLNRESVFSDQRISQACAAVAGLSEDYRCWTADAEKASRSPIS